MNRGGRLFIADDGWVFANRVPIQPATLPVRQADGTIKHIPLTTARVS